MKIPISKPDEALRASPCLHAEVPAFAETLRAGRCYSTQAWSPKTIPTYAKASMGHPPVSEIRRSMADPSLKGFLFGVTHFCTAKAVVFCVGG